MQVVIPGSVESSAVSRVQSMKAPFGSNSLCVGNTCARTAGVRLGLNNSCRAPLPVLAGSRSPTGPPGDPKTVALELSVGGVADAESLSLLRENAGPVNRRSKAISAGDFGVGCDDAPTGDGALAKPKLRSWLMGGSSGAGPKIFSTGTSGSVMGPKLGSGASPAAWLREAVCAVRWAVPRCRKGVDVVPPQKPDREGAHQSQCQHLARA